MKVIKHENGIELVPENDFEKDCLNHLRNNKIISKDWTDSWEGKGNFKIDFIKKEW